MTINKIASEICKREGKKSQARIGDVREILGILSDMFFENHKTCFLNPDQEAVDFDKLLSSTFYVNGKRRAKKAKK